MTARSRWTEGVVRARLSVGMAAALFNSAWRWAAVWTEWLCYRYCFFFSSRRRHTRLQGDWSSDVCSSDLVDDEMIRIRELADDADGAGDHGGRERRQLRHEQPHVRIERRVVEAERQLGLGLRRQRDVAGAGERQARRRGVDLSARIRAPQRERAVP